MISRAFWCRMAYSASVMFSTRRVGSSVMSWLPAMTSLSSAVMVPIILMLSFRDSSSPKLVRSPVWRRISASGMVVPSKECSWVSEMIMIRVETVGAIFGGCVGSFQVVRFGLCGCNVEVIML